jgi:hypothetical protein
MRLPSFREFYRSMKEGLPKAGHWNGKKSGKVIRNGEKKS